MTSAVEVPEQVGFKIKIANIYRVLVHTTLHLLFHLVLLTTLWLSVSMAYGKLFCDAQVSQRIKEQPKATSLIPLCG